VVGVGPRQVHVVSIGHLQSIGRWRGNLDIYFMGNWKKQGFGTGGNGILATD